MTLWNDLVRVQSDLAQDLQHPFYHLVMQFAVDNNLMQVASFAGPLSALQKGVDTHHSSIDGISLVHGLLIQPEGFKEAVLQIQQDQDTGRHLASLLRSVEGLKENKLAWKTFYVRIQLFYSKLVNTLLSSSVNKEVYLNVITKSSPRSTQVLETLRQHLLLIQESSQKHVNQRDKEKTAHLSSLEH